MEQSHQSFFKSPLFGFLAVLFLAIPVTIYLVGQQQNLEQSAWSADQSASARCASNGKVEIEAKFKNTEPSGAEWAMNVVAKDLQTGNESNMGTINSGEEKSVTIGTDRTSIAGGTVRFSLAWADNRSGTDTRTAGYGSVADCPQPSPTPGPTHTPIPPTPPVIPTNTQVPPTHTPVPSPTPTLPTGGGPTPTPTRTPTPEPTMTPTPSVIPTPTDIPPTIVIPTPTGPTSCPIPDKVQNVRVECPYCQ